MELKTRMAVVCFPGHSQTRDHLFILSGCGRQCRGDSREPEVDEGAEGQESGVVSGNESEEMRECQGILFVNTDQLRSHVWDCRTVVYVDTEPSGDSINHKDDCEFLKFL